MTTPPLPSPAFIVETLRARGERDREPAPGDAVLALARRLHRNNLLQWQREDDARHPDADDRAVAAAKRDIDRMNGVRHELIESLDRVVQDVLGDQPTHTPLVTEGPGMVIDRLSVLVLRLESTEERAANASSADGYAARLPRLRAQLRSLTEAATALFDDLAQGRRRYQTYESLKLYGLEGTAAPPPNGGGSRPG